MENGFAQDMLGWITDNPGWAAAVICLIAFIESLVVVGLFIPGIFILFGVGTLIGMGVVDWVPIWIGGSLGAFAGDLVSYLLGHHYQAQIRRFWPFSRYPGMLQRGTAFFRKHGTKSVVVGRFVGPLRPIIPTTVGMLGMPPARFFSVCIPACILWTPAYLLPGLLFGASLDVASEYAGRLALVVALAVAILWLSLWFIRLVYELFAVFSARWLRRAIRWSRRHPVLGRMVGPIIDPSQPEVLSVSMLGILLVATLCGLVLLLFLGPFGAEPGRNDLLVLNWTLTLRNDITDPIMVAISQLSRWWVLLPTLFAALLWLWGAGRKTAAVHWLVAMAGGFMLQQLMDWLLRSMPLLEFAGTQGTFLPSAPITMATVVLGFFSVMVAKELRRRHRKWPYMASTGLMVLLLIARIYLGLDWLSGALAGFVLGLAWTAIVGMAYRVRSLRPFSGAVACLIFYGTLLMAFYWQVGLHLKTDLEAVRIAVEERQVGSEDWWTGRWKELPEERSRYSRLGPQAFNLQLAVPLSEIESRLAGAGWEAVEAAGTQWTLQAINPEANQASLPLTGRNFLGQTEQLVMRKATDDDLQQWVLRLWDSGFRLMPDETPVYLGQVYSEALERRLWFFSLWRPQPYPKGDGLTVPPLLREFRGLQLNNVSDQSEAGDFLWLIRSHSSETAAALPAEPEVGAGAP